VERKDIGIASGLSTFTLNLGGAIGVSVLGAIQTNILSNRLSGLLSGAPPSEAAILSDPNAVGQILASPQALARIVAANPGFAQIIPSLRLAFSQSITSLFIVLLGVSVVLVFVGFLTRTAGVRTAETIVQSARSPGPVPSPPNINSIQLDAKKIELEK